MVSNYYVMSKDQIWIKQRKMVSRFSKELDLKLKSRETSRLPTVQNPNNSLLYVHTSTNHSPQIIKHLTISINKRLNENSSSEQTYNETKSEYVTALKNGGYHKLEIKIH